VGVVHDPLGRQTYYAEKGKGAFVRSEAEPPERLQVSALTDLTQALVGFDLPREPAAREKVVAATARASAATRTMRSIGSAALGLAQVAAGGLDGYYHLTLLPWDMAGGALLIQEAGGRLSSPSGGPWRLDGTGVVTSNGHLHSALLKTLRFE